MPKIAIDHSKALAVLEQTVKEASLPGFRPSSQLKDAVAQILCGGHLTYKYVLATALLAKAVEPDANPLVLQAGARVPGAYDARSLCHKVIVPHEARLLANALGGSNEPFLNKPARFKTVSLDNAVRAGRDTRTLISLHKALSSLKSSEQARLALRDLVFVARQHKSLQTSILKNTIGSAVGGRSEICAFLTRVISTSVHGETSALAAAAVLWIMGRSRGQEWTLQVHPVNESGSSSNEVSDIDVYSGKELLLTVEVKDKRFKEHDVEHALEKVAAVGHDALHFICGPHGELHDGSQESLMAMAATTNVELLMLDLTSLIPNVVSFAPKALTLKEVADQVRRYAEQARVKPETLEQITLALAPAEA
jgi:SacI-like restriction endonuclease